ncbi:hypothetical protein [Lysinibacillus sphaericus]|uniref:hypothetical protein n=1 Tax=Lysinibacillus sphaericus TaxID=1421 RepID=UPI0005641AB5|nr:hypothetical protein [Lysinibacillus sphaericus]
MPLIFPKLTIYSIDYPKLSQHFSKLPILNNSQLQKTFIEDWLKELKIHDKVLVDELNSPEKIRNYAKNALAYNELEVFQQQLTMGDVEVFIHFRVSALLQIIKMHGPVEGKKIALTEFTKEKTQFLWDSVETDPTYPINNEPILIVPFLNGQYNFLVIDGNHRVSSAVKAKLNYIETLTLAEHSVIDLEIFSSGFDKLLYIFFNEMSHLANKRHYENLSDKELLKLSYLHKGEYKF